MDQKTALIVALCATFIWLPLGLAGMVPAAFSGFMFDAPGSEKNIALIILAISLITFPVVCAAAVIASWAALWSKAFRGACWCASIPLTNIATAAVAFAWVVLTQ
ncbi:MAG TPA: hypothetical protein VGN12_23185 [Pirellulales bacterium]|jgi:hypothetical protein